MASQSAGILLYRLERQLELFLVHPGGPYWQKKDLGAWSIPKGEFTDKEDPLVAAKREFEEETGVAVSGNFIQLEPIKQKGGKTIYAWAVQGDIDASLIRSNVFSIEWPPGSGKQREFPEIDKAEWFSVEQAREKINPAQATLILQLQLILEARTKPS
jgi:predicted NUDIX family NTP pyrophosphohydrolase